MKKILAGLLALSLLCALFGCGGADKDATEPEMSALISTYTQAADPLRNAQNLDLELTTETKITTLGGVSSSVSEQELTLTGIGTDAFCATRHEALELGDYEDELTEYYTDGTVYLNVYDEGFFQAEMTAEDFQARYAPAVLLDETLYKTVTSTETNFGEALTFSDPTGPESWALPENSELLSASGIAFVSEEGVLTRTVYEVEYLCGSARISSKITAKAELGEGAAPEIPEDSDRYIKVDAIDAIRLYESAIMYICDSETATFGVNETIVCQAAGSILSEQTQLHYIGADEDHMSEVRKTLTYFEGTGANTTYTLTEKFRDGAYTSSENGGQFTPDSGVGAQDMFGYLQSYSCDNHPALEYVSNAKLEDVNGLCYLEMELTPEWGEAKAKDLAYRLFEDESYLDNYATAYETATATYYLFLDPATGLPLSSGINYSGLHTIEGQKYTLLQELSQSYLLMDSSTYTAITGENAPETAPEEQATPLLYRVTGTDGQQMYLMGTIHVGDAKTGHLPEEVYEAFNASDALAVEADIIAFEEKLENDPAFAQQFAEATANPSEKTAKELLDADVYETAVKLMQAGGNYSSNAEFMPLHIWSSSIENLYLNMSDLRSEKGMDMRLLLLAKSQDKPVLEVESAVDQYRMFANFSTDLQVLILEDTVLCTGAEYRADVQTLYDLWCAGDEAELREVLSEEPEGLSAAELALQKEYTDAMIIQRNKGMHTKAVSYLESGDTVFVAVGLAHLLQENGLVDTLREAGYTVEQITYQ